MSGGSEYESLPIPVYKCTSDQRNFYCRGEAAWDSLPGELRNYASLKSKNKQKAFSLTSFNCPYTNTEIRLLSSVKNYNYMRFNIAISTL